MKWDEYGFILIYFVSLIPISNQSFAFPLHVDKLFFFSDPKERGWKIILKNESHRKWITNKVQIDPT